VSIVIEFVALKEKIAAVIIEHDMDIIFRYSDRIVVMNQGRILASGILEEIQQDPLVREMVFGPSHA
jgi:ABC-type branched-subunit amino acid transport system ATPase component